MLERWKRARKIEAARREAEALAEVLKSASAEDRRTLLAVFPEFRSWAVAERLAHDSALAAAHRVDEARALAELALEIARQVPGEAQRARTTGYCTGFLANVERVATEFDLARALFKCCETLWRGRRAGRLPADRRVAAARPRSLPQAGATPLRRGQRATGSGLGGVRRRRSSGRQALSG